jgi:hypothetical protein
MREVIVRGIDALLKGVLAGGIPLILVLLFGGLLYFSKKGVSVRVVLWVSGILLVLLLCDVIALRIAPN